MDISTAQSTGLSRIQPILEFLGSTSILVILMGLPATLHQYSTFNVPIALLSYRRVLEAGILPAILVVLFLIYLDLVERNLSELKKSVFVDIPYPLSPRKTKILDLSLPTIPFIYLSIIIFFTGYLAAITWGFWGVSWVTIKPIEWLFDEFILSNRWMIVLGFNICLLVFLIKYKISKKLYSSFGWSLLPSFFVFIIKFYEWVFWGVGWVIIKPIEWLFGKFILSDSWMIFLGFITVLVCFIFRKYIYKPAYNWVCVFFGVVTEIKSFTLKDALIRSLFYYLFFPVIIVFCAYLTKTGILLVGLPWHVSLTQNTLIKGGAFIGMAYAHSMSISMLSKFRVSLYKETREGAKIAIRMIYSVFVTVCIVLYSFFIYPHLPRNYGGGNPEILDVVTSGSVVPDHLRHLFTVNAFDNIYIEKIHLIDKTTDEMIFCKVQQTTHKCFALPNSSIVSMSWQYDGTYLERY